MGQWNIPRSPYTWEHNHEFGVSLGNIVRFYSKKQNRERKLEAVVLACNPSCLSGYGRKILHLRSDIKLT